MEIIQKDVRVRLNFRICTLSPFIAFEVKTKRAKKIMKI